MNNADHDRRAFEKHWNEIEVPMLKEQFPRITARQLASMKDTSFACWLADAWSDRAVPEKAK